MKQKLLCVDVHLISFMLLQNKLLQIQDTNHLLSSPVFGNYSQFHYKNIKRICQLIS